MTNMNISYQALMDWFRENLKLLIVMELVCLLFAAAYFFMSPRIYEATFALSLPKVLSTPVNANLPRLKLLISPQEFIRPTQDPMAYSTEFIKACMGEDSNWNRKKFINALALGVKQQGDVISFTLRLEGQERSAICANALLLRAFDYLTVNQERYLDVNIPPINDPDSFIKPAVVQAIRISDSFIKPDLNRLITTAVTAGIFLTIFISFLKNKYRA
jgi:capsular polysaccharide biosynthesis protein